MKRWIHIPVLLLLAGCNSVQNETYFSHTKATVYFRSIDSLCSTEKGKLWGENIYGPLMLIDRGSRKITANEADNQGLLKEKDGIFTGYYPKELLINFSAVTYGGKLFAMAPLPQTEDNFKIKTNAVHGLFHRFQEENGLTAKGYNTNNMDEAEARLWIKLEWKALRKAICSDGETQLLAIRDALIFRGSNRELYRKYANDENRFETYEGLDTFTYLLLCTKTTDEFRTKLFENLSRIYSMQSFSRSYGYIHGALYATLLNDKGFDFKTIRTENFDLGNAVKELYTIELPPICRDVAGSLAVNYGTDEIKKEEDERLAVINKSIQQQISTFTEKPVVFFELESPYFDFEPEDIHSLDTLGTLYTSMRVSDNWGKLTVDESGCLISNNLKYLKISAKDFNKDRNKISGAGWQVIMNDGWELIKVDQNYFVRKLMP